MLDKAIKGSPQYWSWIIFLLALIGVGFGCYLYQWFEGLRITGMSRDVSWGFYIGQLTYFVGVAASGVMVVLPYYLHDYKAFGKITILGEFVAVASIVMCGLFVMVDLGNLPRMLNIIIYPNPTSILFWDMIVLNGYLFLNLVIGWTTLGADRRGVPAPGWVKPLIYLSIPWAISIHTVTAFIYQGLAARPFWMTAILAPRFLASAFCSGPAILLILFQILRRTTSIKIKDEAIWKIAELMAYAMFVNLFLFGAEIFKEYYSNTHHLIHTQYLYSGAHGHTALVPYAWASILCSVIAFVLFLVPATRRNFVTLNLGCLLIYTGVYIEKGMALVIPGMTPDTLGEIYEYTPNFAEIAVSLGIWGIGLLLFTLLVKAALPIECGTLRKPGVAPGETICKITSKKAQQ